MGNVCVAIVEYQISDVFYRCIFSKKKTKKKYKWTKFVQNIRSFFINIVFNVDRIFYNFGIHWFTIDNWLELFIIKYFSFDFLIFFHNMYKKRRKKPTSTWNCCKIHRASSQYSHYKINGYFIKITHFWHSNFVHIRTIKSKY